MRVRSGDVDIDECCQLRRVHAVSLCAGENYIISERTESSERERAFLAIAVAYSFFIRFYAARGVPRRSLRRPMSYRPIVCGLCTMDYGFMLVAETT